MADTGLADHARGRCTLVLRAARFGLGGVIGSGDQWMSCISLPDVVRAIMFAIRTPELDGVVNFTAPHPATNRDFTKALGKALKRPTVFPLPAPVRRWWAWRSCLADCRSR